MVSFPVLTAGLAQAKKIHLASRFAIFLAEMGCCFCKIVGSYLTSGIMHKNQGHCKVWFGLILYQYFGTVGTQYRNVSEKQTPFLLKSHLYVTKNIIAILSLFF